MPCPAPCIISISGALTSTQIVGPASLPRQIPWKGMGGSLCINDPKVPYAILVWCSGSYNVPSMHLLAVQTFPAVALQYSPLSALYGRSSIMRHFCRGYQVDIVSVSHRKSVIFRQRS